MTYTIEQMIEIWRERLALMPTLEEGSVERFDGIDLDAALRRSIRDWHLHLLDHGDVNMLCPEEIGFLTTYDRPTNGIVRITLPDNCRRVTSIILENSRYHTTIISPEDPQIHRMLRIFANPFIRKSLIGSIAIIHSPTYITVFSPEDTPTIKSMLAILDSGEDSIKIHPSALATIPHQIQLMP